MQFLRPQASGPRLPNNPLAFAAEFRKFAAGMTPQKAEEQVRQMLADGRMTQQQFGQINDRLTNLGNGVCNLGYEMQGGLGQLGKEVALGQSNLQQTIMGTGNGIQQQIAGCCCENRLAMANLSAQMDRQTCDITTAIHSEGEQTRALMQANTIQQLRDKVNALELAGQMAGVVRYPTGYAYNAGPSPFCGGGCAACA